MLCQCGQCVVCAYFELGDAKLSSNCLPFFFRVGTGSRHRGQIHDEALHLCVCSLYRTVHAGHCAEADVTSDVHFTRAEICVSYCVLARTVVNRPW